MPLLLQFSIALCTGLVAATLIPSVRRVVPRLIEMVLWVALVVVCVIGVVSTTNPRARELTTSAFWGVDQIITTLFGLLVTAVTGWFADNRFTIAGCLAVVFAVDVMALALLRSWRESRGWQPRVRLYEWMELPPLAVPAAEPVPVPYAIDELNRKVAAAMTVAGAALFIRLVNVSIWARDVVRPRVAALLTLATAAGRVESRARLESLRVTALHLQFAARRWYVTAGAPAASRLAAKATDAVRAIGDGRVAAELMPGRAVDIHVLLAQSIGWYGPVRPTPTVFEGEDEDESGQTGRLAS